METARDPATTAVGFFELGMMEDAWSELESLPPEIRFDGLAFETRCTIICISGRWEFGEESAAALVVEFPEYPMLWLHWAHCLERTRPIEAARMALERAAQLHPEAALIPYNLARYACALVQLDDARQLLARAVSLDQALAVLAAGEADLAPIHRAAN